LESTLRRTVTSAYFVALSCRGLLRCGVVAVTVVALQDLVCLRFGAVTVVTVALDLVCPARSWLRNAVT
jgi:hypothetical protein